MTEKATRLVGVFSVIVCVVFINFWGERFFLRINGMENRRIVVEKKNRVLRVFDGKKLRKSYPIALGFSPTGDKETEGDGKTPEGKFFIYAKNPESKYFLSLGISYPAIEDAKRGLDAKIITQTEHDEIVAAINEERMPPQKTALGGEIYIHGNGNADDWTAGCIALSDSDMRKIFDEIEIRTPIEILP